MPRITLSHQRTTTKNQNERELWLPWCKHRVGNQSDLRGLFFTSSHILLENGVKDVDTIGEHTILQTEISNGLWV